MDPNKKSQSQSKILPRLIKVAAAKSARLGLCVLAVGSLAILLPAGSIDPQLAAIAGGLGVNAFSGLLDRIAYDQDKKTSDPELLREIESTLNAKHFAELLMNQEFKQVMSQLFEQQGELIQDIMRNSESSVSNILLGQLEQYQLLRTDLRDGLYAIQQQIKKQEADAERRHQEMIAELRRRENEITNLHSIFSIPPVPRGFIGRQDVLSNIVQVLGNPDKTILYLGGIRGIGKTFLAARLYREVGQNGNHQLLWVNCQTNVTLEIMLDALAKASGDTALSQSVRDPEIKISERIDHVIRRFLDPRRVIIFLENYDHQENRNLEPRDSLDEFISRAAVYGEHVKLVLIGPSRPRLLDDHQLRGTFWHTGENTVALTVAHIHASNES